MLNSQYFGKLKENESQRTNYQNYMNTIEELKKKMSKAQKMLDILLKMFGIQTQIERLQLELMIRIIAKEEGVDEDF